MNNIFIYSTLGDGSQECYKYDKQNPNQLKELVYKLHCIISHPEEYRQVTISNVEM